MPKDTSRFVSSTMAARKSRVQPIPDFHKLHRQWENKNERRKQTFARSTVPDEFDLTKSGRKVSKSAACPEQKSSKVMTRSMAAESATHQDKKIQQPITAEDEFDFQCDVDALHSILTDAGITMQPPADPSARTKTVSFMTAMPPSTSSRLTMATLQAPSPSVAGRGYWIKDRSSIYDKWVPAVGYSIAKVSSSVKCAPAGRVPLQFGNPFTRTQQLTAPSTDFIARRTRSRLDSNYDKTPVVDNAQSMVTSSAQRLATSKRTDDLAKTASRVPRSRSASKPRAARHLLTENDSGNTSTPRVETRSGSRKNNEANLARMIVFDDVEIHSRQTVQESASRQVDDSVKKSSTSVRRGRRSSTVDGARRPMLDAFYQDMDYGVHASPSSPWRDNIISSGLGGNVRSPLSVIGRQQLNRQGNPHPKETRKPHSDYLASAKDAMSEMKSMEKRLNKENLTVFACHAGPTSYGESVQPDVLSKPIVSDHQAAVSKTKQVAVGTVVNAWSSAVINENEVSVVYDESIEEDNKENQIVDHDENSMSRMITESSALQKQARSLRRRSQLTHDAGEQKSLKRQLEILQQRRRELDAKMLEIEAKLQPSIGTSTRTELVTCHAQVSHQPLNLKISENVLTCPEGLTSFYTDQPLNLKVSVSGNFDTVDSFNSKDGRKILGDITEQIVGGLTDDDYFEVPDSPEPSDEIIEDEHVLHDTGLSQPLDLCIVKRPAVDCTVDCTATNTTPVKNLPEYLASLNLSAISDVAIVSPRSVEHCNTSVSSASGSPASPDISSEFIGYRKYCRLLIEEDVDRCGDPVATMLCDGDDQHFLPIAGESPK